MYFIFTSLSLFLMSAWHGFDAIHKKPTRGRWVGKYQFYALYRSRILVPPEEFPPPSGVSSLVPVPLRFKTNELFEPVLSLLEIVIVPNLLSIVLGANLTSNVRSVVLFGPIEGWSESLRIEKSSLGSGVRIKPVMSN